MLARPPFSFSGRYREAIDAADVAASNFGRDAGFAVRYAKLMSLTNSLDKADQWLTYAYSLGLKDINGVRATPDLANLRAWRPQRFAELTTVRLRPEIVWGLMFDDVILHNDSAFDVTNLRATMFIRQGQRTWNVSLGQCTSIRAGGTCKAVNVMSIPDDRYDQADLRYDCDQVVH